MSGQPCGTDVLNGRRILRTGSCELVLKVLQQLLLYTLSMMIYLFARWFQTRYLKQRMENDSLAICGITVAVAVAWYMDGFLESTRCREATDRRIRSGF